MSYPQICCTHCNMFLCEICGREGREVEFKNGKWVHQEKDLEWCHLNLVETVILPLILA